MLHYDLERQRACLRLWRKIRLMQSPPRGTAYGVSFWPDPAAVRCAGVT